MLVSGWILFIVGFALIFFGAFVGVEGLMNLPSTLSAVAFMISGAIFVGIDKLDQILDVLKTPAPKSADTLALPERKTRSVLTHDDTKPRSLFLHTPASWTLAETALGIGNPIYFQA